MKRLGSMLAAALVAAFIAAALVPDGNAADAATTMGIEPADEIATALRPGMNVIGWTAEPAPVSRLFSEIPELSTVWKWDALNGRWRGAARDGVAGDGSGFGIIQPGDGIVLVLKAGRSAEWERKVAPVYGRVELDRGLNLVAWAGRDEVPLAHALKGIGTSLISATIWDPDDGRWRSSSDLGPDAVINRGDALWVRVEQRIKWLQPTYLMPATHFPGDVPLAVQQAAREGLQDVLQHFDEKYAIQADPFELDVYFPSSCDAFVDYVRAAGDSRGTREHTCYRANGYATWSGETVVRLGTPLTDGQTSVAAGTLATLAHEYTHQVQFSLTDRRGWGLPAPDWLVEGSASYSGTEFLQAEHEAGEHYSLADLEGAPTLASTEQTCGPWQYILGAVGTARLTEIAGDESWIEFWRKLTSDRTGSSANQIDERDWRDAFRDAFGITSRAFYRSFEQWRSATSIAPSVTGSVQFSDGVVATSGIVNAHPIDPIDDGNEIGHSLEWSGEINQYGQFTVHGLGPGAYRLSVDLSGRASASDSCLFWYRRGVAVRDQFMAAHLVAGQPADANVTITIPSGECGRKLNIRVIDVSKAPVTSYEFEIMETYGDGSIFASGRKPANAEGGVEFYLSGAAATSGKLHLSAGCSLSIVRISSLGASSRWSAATVQAVDDRSIEVFVRLPAGTCEHTLRGIVLDADDQPVSHVGVDVRPLIYHPFVPDTVFTDRIGRFSAPSITAGEQGVLVRLGWTANCFLHATYSEASPNPADARGFLAESSDAQEIIIRLPENACSIRIAGTFAGWEPTPDRVSFREWATVQYDSSNINADGRPIDTTYSSLDPVNGTTRATLTHAGDYRISIDLARFPASICMYRVRAGSGDRIRAEHTIRFEAGIENEFMIQLPSDWCSYTVRGRLISADGSALEGERVDVLEDWQGLGREHSAGAWTLEDGWFEIKIPTGGWYSVHASLQDCYPYVTTSGELQSQMMSGELPTMWLGHRDVSLGTIVVPDGICN